MAYQRNSGDKTNDRRQVMLTAARRLIEADDDGLSMRRLAAATGTGPMTAYSLFGSKAGLLFALLDQDRVKFVDYMLTLRVGGSVQRLFDGLSAACELYRENPRFHRFVMRQYFLLDDTNFRNSVDQQRYAVLHPIVQRITEEHDTVAIGVDAIIQKLSMVYVASLMRWCLDRTDLSQLEQEMGLAFTVVLRGVLSNPDEVAFEQLMGRYCPTPRPTRNEARKTFDGKSTI